MRLDHVAYRVKDRTETAKFFIDAFGYRIDSKIPEGFDIQFEDNTTAKCLVLLPPEKYRDDIPFSINQHISLGFWKQGFNAEFHMAPELFISDGSSGSVVKTWVEKRDDIGGIHHMAFQVDDVLKMMEFMKEKGYAEFTTEEPLSCPGLTQVFTKPSKLTGIIYEFIKRDAQGFCKDNVKDLMKSTKGL
jgi:catechol 2,3-dioxygenase-like lactoylglutathione lyase family enzyme